MVRRYLQFALFLITFLPIAKAADFPFYVTSQASTRACIECTGPWLRDSGPARVEAGVVNFNFYTASDGGIIPVSGKWECVISRPLELVDCLVPAINVSRVDFCFDPGIPSMRDVHITVRPDLGSTVDKPSECVGSSAKAVLGDTHNQGVDRDDFQFAGEGGERVTIRLLPDGSSGHLGTTASLMLRGPSGKTIASQNGAPALELQTTLPEAGTYEIRVAEPGDPDEDSYRGHYVLQLSREDASSSVPSTGRNVLSLKPKRNVEY